MPGWTVLGAVPVACKEAEARQETDSGKPWFDEVKT